MTKRNLATLVAAMGAAIVVGERKEYFDLSSDTGNGYSTKPKEAPKRGTKFIFEDGFECYALNQKNADRKHNNWLKARKEDKNGE